MIAYVYMIYHLIYLLYKRTGWSGYSKQNKYPKLLSALICVFSAKSPEAHQSPQLGWLALELLCCSSHPKDLVFEDRQTTPKEWRRASEWSNLGEERNACIGVVSVFVQVDVLFMRSKRQFSDVIVGNHLTRLGECWPTYLLRHFMEPWDFRKQTHGWETATKTKWLIATVDETMQRFTHTISASVDMILSLDAIIRWFSTSEPCQIAAKDHVITRHSIPMPNLTNGYGKAVFALLSTWALGKFQLHWAQENHRPTTRGSLCNPSVNLCQQSKPYKKNTNYIHAVFRQLHPFHLLQAVLLLQGSVSLFFVPWWHSGSRHDIPERNEWIHVLSWVVLEFGLLRAYPQTRKKLLHDASI